MSVKVTHFVERGGKPVTLEVKRQKWFVTGDHPSTATAGVLEMADGTVRNAYVARPGHFGLHQHVVSSPNATSFWETVNSLREMSGVTFEHSLKSH